jgi:hypothetical protein
MSTTTATQQAIDLRPLDPEPWGSMFRRVRGDLHLDELARQVCYFTSTSAATLSRMEARASIPRRASQLEVAVVACVLCGVDPAALGLSVDDLPPRTAAGLRDASEVGIAQTRCTGLFAAWAA